MSLKIFKTVFVVLLINVSLTKAQSSCGIPGKSSGTITKLEPERGAWPWIASIHMIQGDHFMCTGNLIGENMVLTAAHCLQPKKSKANLEAADIVVKLGKHDLSERNERGSQLVYVSQVIVNPRWNKFATDYEGDVAILVLENKVEFSDVISPICLWDEKIEPKEKKGTLVGWGRSEEKGKQVKKQHELKATLQSASDCFSKNPKLEAMSSNDTFCATKNAPSDMCTGDTGASLYMRSESKQYYLRGIVSGAHSGECSSSDNLLLSDVHKNNKWINQQALISRVSFPKLEPKVDLTKLEPKKFNKEIYCFLESWGGSRPGVGVFTLKNLKPELCTTIVFLHAELDGDSLKPIDQSDLTAETSLQLFKKVNALKRTYRLRTLLSVGSWNEGSVKYSQLSADPERRKKFAENSAEYLKLHGFDGLHFHWEHPAHRGGAKEDKDNFVLLLKDIYEHYQQHNLYQSAFIRVQTETVAKAYDLEKIAKYVDAVCMMTFDLWGYWKNTVGFHAPLRGDGEDNIESRVNFFISQGVPAEKIILGIPFFGRTFVTRNEGNIGDESDTGFAGPFITEIGHLGHQEQCYIRDEHEWETRFDERASQAVAKYKDNGLTHVVTYDTPRSTANKAKYVVENNLGGVWVWFVDSDDFRGDCEPDNTTFADFPNVSAPPRPQRDFPLLRSINEAFELLTTSAN